MWVALIAVETISVFVMLTRWSKRFAAGDYDYRNSYGIHDSSGGPFVAHLAMGLFPLVGIAYLLGTHLNEKEVKHAAQQKKLADNEKEAAKLLKEAGVE